MSYSEQCISDEVYLCAAARGREDLGAPVVRVMVGSLRPESVNGQPIGLRIVME